VVAFILRHCNYGCSISEGGREHRLHSEHASGQQKAKHILDDTPPPRSKKPHSDPPKLAVDAGLPSEEARLAEQWRRHRQCLLENEDREHPEREHVLDDSARDECDAREAGACALHDVKVASGVEHACGELRAALHEAEAAREALRVRNPTRRRPSTGARQRSVEQAGYRERRERGEPQNHENGADRVEAAERGPHARVTHHAVLVVGRNVLAKVAERDAVDDTRKRCP
jgi:hypothetical protein